MRRLWLRRVTHAKKYCTWVAFGIASLQLIIPPCNTRKQHHRQQQCHVQKGECRPDHQKWRRMSILKLIRSIRLHGSSLTRAPMLWGIPRQVWGCVMELFSALHLPVRTRSWWRIPGAIERHEPLTVLDQSRTLTREDFHRLSSRGVWDIRRT